MGWSNPVHNPKYSKDFLEVSCKSNEGFKVKPYFKIIKINGYNATGYLQGKTINNNKNHNPNPIKIGFAAYWNANYTLVGACQIFGAQINNILDINKYSIIVSDAPSGNIPLDYISSK